MLKNIRHINELVFVLFISMGNSSPLWAVGSDDTGAYAEQSSQLKDLTGYAQAL